MPGLDPKFAVILGVLWAWLIVQEAGLADRWDAPAIILDIIILAASVGVCYGGLFFLERMTGGSKDGVLRR